MTVQKVQGAAIVYSHQGPDNTDCQVKALAKSLVVLEVGTSAKPNLKDPVELKKHKQRSVKAAFTSTPEKDNGEMKAMLA